MEATGGGVATSLQLSVASLLAIFISNQNSRITIFGVRKLYLGYLTAFLCDPTFSRFSRIPNCDRRIDRQAHDDGKHNALA